MKLVYRFRVMLTILIVAFLMVAAFSFNNYYDTKRLMIENYIQNLEDKLSLQAEQFDQIMQQMYQQAVHISKQESIQELIADIQQDAPSKLAQAAYSERLAAMQSAGEENMELFLYVPQTQQAISSIAYHSNLHVPETTLSVLMDRAESQSLTPVFMENPLIQSAQHVFCYAIPVQNATGEQIALIGIMWDERLLYYELFSSLNTATEEKYRLLAPDGSIHSAASAEELERQWEGFPVMQGKKINADVQQDNSLTVSVIAPLSQYYMVCQSDLQSVSQGLQKLLLSQMLKLFFSFVILFLLSILLSHWLAKPLRDLAQAMDAVRDGDFTTRVQQPKTDEFSALHARFNDLIARLDELTDQVVVERMQKKQAEINALQYQIRPHFMYNTLNSIRFTAMLQRNQKLADLLGDFIALLESSVQRNGAFILLQEEINLVRSYVSLQSFRHMNCFSVAYEIAPEAADCYVPCLLLQPAVENAIFHGIDAQRTDNLIRITASVHEDALEITVEDNGSGFDASQLAEPAADDSRRLTGIGIRNTEQRLHLYYQKRAQLIINSVPGKGTCARFVLPVSHDPQEYEI